MLKIRIHDAAGPTFQASGLDNLGYNIVPDGVQLVSASDTRVRLEGGMDSPFDTYRIDYLGDLRPARNPDDWDTGIERFVGPITATREYFDGRLAVTTEFLSEVQARTFINGWASRFYSGVDFRGNRFANEFNSENGDDVLVGGSGNDRFWSQGGRDLLDGGGGDDELIAGEGSDVLRGREGSDSLNGHAGNDTLNGGDGGDRLRGDEGADRLIASLGIDRMSGGAGADRFQFASLEIAGLSHAQRKTIIDFGDGADLVDLARIDADTATAGDDAFGFIGAAVFGGQAGELRFAEGLLQGDVDGDDAADFRIALAGAPSVDADDLLL